jgi:hypothetical protein
MQHTSSTPPTLIENFKMLPLPTPTISDVTSTNDTSYVSLDFFNSRKRGFSHFFYFSHHFYLKRN